MILELVLLSASGAAVVAGGITAAVHWLVSRQTYHIEGPPPMLALTSARLGVKAPGGSNAQRRAIPAAIQAEIDQTPEWWEQEFHRSLARAGAERVEDETYEPEVYEEVSFNGARLLSYVTPAPYYLVGCSCSRCEQVRQGLDKRRIAW